MSHLMELPAREAEREKRASHSRVTKEVQEEVKRRTRRSFLTGGVAAAACYGLWRVLTRGAYTVNNLRFPLRAAEDMNASLSRHVLGDAHLVPTFPAAQAVRTVRLNGNIGIDSGLKLDSWRLGLTGLAQPHAYKQSVPDVNAWKYESSFDENNAGDNSTDGAGGIPQSSGAKGGGEISPKSANSTDDGALSVAPITIVVNEHATADRATTPQPGVLLTMEEIRSLPHVDLTDEFKCIEGWSQIVHWGGVRFADLIARYQPVAGPSGGRARYVSVDTPNGDYFVGLDIEDALYPQTLLCYEINGEPLTMEHGAPLRLVMPMKYGIKHLKQIGKITFTNTKPRDYWEEQGYDWYQGL